MEEKETKKSVFQTLNDVNVGGHTEERNGLTYLSWAWAWAEVKKRYPTANYTVYERRTNDGLLVNYFTDGRTCWVKTGVMIDGVEHIEMLPVMDYKNKSINLENITSFDVNKSIQRSLTKAIARHGLGLYVYAGEDLPETEVDLYRKELEEAIKEIQITKSVEDLQKLWNNHERFQQDKEFKASVIARKTELQKQQ